MPTLEGLTSFGLRFADPQDAASYGDRAVVGVSPAENLHGSPTAPTERGTLVVVTSVPPWLNLPPVHVLDTFTDVGVSAIAIHGRAAPDSLAERTRAHDLPLLLLNPSVSLPQLIQAVDDLQQREEAALSKRLQQLHNHVREMASGRWEEVIDWLQQVLEPGKVLLAGPHDRITELPVTDESLTDLRTGRRDVAVLQSGPWTIRLHALGKERPRPVLVVASPGSSFGALPGQAVTRALPFLELALEVRRAREIRQASEQGQRRTDAMLLRLLISGDINAARHAAQPLQLSARLMDARSARMYQFRCPADQREELIAACTCILQRNHLIVRDPSLDTETTVIARDDTDFSVEAALRAIVADRTDHHLGISRRVPLEQLPLARDEAHLALDAAVQSGSPVGDYDSLPDLTPLLLSEPAHAWASRFLAPLDAKFAPENRRNLLQTVALWLRYGTRGVVQTGLRISRNTVRPRVRIVEEALGLDLDLFGHRVVLDLAIRIDLLPGPPQRPATAMPTPTLEELFASPLARQWADRLLGVLPDDSRQIRRTLIAWLAAGTHSATAASTLRMHRKTLNIHLLAAESALRTKLLGFPDPPSLMDRTGLLTGPAAVRDALSADYVGPIDLALAALASGELPYSQLNRTARYSLEVLGQVTTKLSTAFDALEATQDLANAMLGLGKSVAYVTVNLAPEVFTGQEPPLRKRGADVGLRRAALACRDGATWPEGFLQPGDDLPALPDKPTILRHLRGEALWLPDLETILEALDHDPSLVRALVPSPAVTALIHAPLKAGGRIIGSVEVWGADSAQPFIPDDLQLLTEITSHAAVSVENARRAARGHGDRGGPADSPTAAA